MFVTLKFITGGEQQVALPGLRIVNDPVHGTVALIPEVGGPKAYALDMSHEEASTALVETLSKVPSAVAERLGAIEERLEEHARSIGLIPQYIKDVNARYEAFEDGLTKKILARRIGRRSALEVQLGALEEKLEDRLGGVYKDLGNDDKRIRDLEKGLAGANSRLAELERKASNEAAFNKIGDHVARSNDHERRISILETDLPRLQTIINGRTRVTDEKFGIVDVHVVGIFGALDKFSGRILKLEEAGAGDPSLQDRIWLRDRIEKLSRIVDKDRWSADGHSDRISTMSSQIDSLGNQLRSLQESLDALSERLGQTNQNVQALGTFHKVSALRLKKLEEGGAVVRCLSSSPDVDERIDKLRKDVDHNFKRIQHLENAMDREGLPDSRTGKLIAKVDELSAGARQNTSLVDSLFRHRGWATECIHKLQDELKALGNSLSVAAEDHGDLHARTGELEDRLISLEKKTESCSKKGPAYPQPGPWRELEGADLSGEAVYLLKPRSGERDPFTCQGRWVPFNISRHQYSNYIYMEIPE